MPTKRRPLRVTNRRKTRPSSRWSVAASTSASDQIRTHSQIYDNGHIGSKRRDQTAKSAHDIHDGGISECLADLVRQAAKGITRICARPSARDALAAQARRFEDVGTHSLPLGLWVLAQPICPVEFMPQGCKPR